MQTIVLRVDPKQPEADRIFQAATVLKNGGLVAFPTETVYGLGANAFDSEAVSRIFVAKGRPANNPIIVHVASVEQAQSLVTHWPDEAEKLTNRFWPGPLTIVLPRNAVVPDIVTAGGPTVAIRVAANPVALALLQATGLPLAAPSANRSTYLSPTKAEHVLEGLQGRIDLLLDAGATSGGIESTVVDLTTEPPRLLRPGLVSVAQIETTIGPIESTSSSADAAADKILRSPGMMKRHYAPRASVECFANDSWNQVLDLLGKGLRVGWLTFGPSKVVNHVLLTQVEMPMEPAPYAGRLYSTLYALDKARVERIIVDLPPDLLEWFAVRDRLVRAAAPGD